MDYNYSCCFRPSSRRLRIISAFFVGAVFTLSLIASTHFLCLTRNLLLLSKLETKPPCRSINSFNVAGKNNNGDNIINDGKGTSIPRNLVLPEISPRPDSFFLVETSGAGTLGQMSLCALESAARHHPDHQVHMVMVTDTVQASDLLVTLLATHPNLNLLHIDFESFILDSPLESLWRKGRVQESQFLVSHLSDVLRFLLLHRFGGTYLDSDQIVLRPFPQQRNFVGLESDWAASGVMRFQRSHPILREFLTELSSAFDGTDWGSNGPVLLSNVIRHICGNADSLHGLNPDQCLGLVLFPKEAFYPVHWTSWEKLFDPDYSDWIMEAVAESTAVHLWGRQSQGRVLNDAKEDHRLEHGVSRLAEKNCPVTWGASQ